MISIVTVCHKSASLLPAYVASFLEHNAVAAEKDQIEFVFIENSSNRETGTHTAALRERGFEAKVLMTENHGFGAGCNAGAQLAKGRLLVFANPDIRFLTTITPLGELFNGTRWGTIQQKRDAKSVYAFDLLPEYRSFISELLRPYRFMHKLPRLNRLCYPIGSFMIVPRDVFLNIGGFDERFFLYYEEAELSRRLHVLLGPPVYSEAVSILHEGFGTQDNTEFTLREEAKGIVTYANVIGQPGLADRRVRMLKKLAVVSKRAAQRINYLQEAIRNDACGGVPVGSDTRG